MLQYSKKTIIIFLSIAVMLYIAAIAYNYSYKHSENSLTLDASNMTELVINTKNADVIVDSGDSSIISIKGLRTRALIYEKNENEYKINAESKGLLKERKCTLRVTLPSSMKSLSISSELGDIAINNAYAENVAIALANGDIDIENSNCDIAIKSMSGDIKLIDTTSTSIMIDSKSGDIDAIGINAASLDISLGAGDIYVSPSKLGKLDIHAILGNIELDLDEEPGSIAWSTKAGTFYINDEEATSKTLEASGTLIVNASSINGDLELNY